MYAGDRDRHSSRYPPQERIYENAEYVDVESPPRYLDEGQSYEEPPAAESSSNPGHSNNRSGSNKMRIMSGNSAPAAPSSAPPKSLLEAAVGRPVTQRGLDHQQQAQSSRHNNQSSSSNSRRYNDYGSENDDDLVNTTAIDIHPQHGHYQPGAPALSNDDMV